MKSIAAALAGVLLAGVAAAAPASAADPIMPLAEVQPGMQCEGRTVIRGTAISTFDVEVIDVIRGGPPHLDRILVRVSGPAVDATGVGPGFSGSPIYCPGSGGPANAGAISEGVGEHGNKVALATPIEEILREGGAAPAASTTRRLGSARPLTGPLTLSGLSPAFAQIVRRAARRAGAQLVVSPADVTPVFPPQDLVPGSAVAVSLASGDFAMSGVGTVAYRDGDRVWAFGHSFDAVGPRNLFLLDAYVYTVVNNPLGAGDLSTYKLAAPGHITGTVFGDGLSAVVGRLGPAPEHTLLSVYAEDEDSGRVATAETQIADETALGLPGNATSVVPFVVADTGVAAVRGQGTDVSGSMCVELQLRERALPLRLCNRYFGDRQTPGAVQGEMALDSEIATALVDELASRRPIHFDEVRVLLSIRRGAELLELERVKGPRRVRPGRRIRVSVSASPPRGNRRTFSFPVSVPRKLRPGKYRLVLTGGALASSFELLGLEEGVSLERLFARLLSPEGTQAQEEEGQEGPVRTLAQLEDRLAKLRRYPGIRARFVRVQKQVEEDESLELLEELFGGFGESQKGSQRVYRHPVFGLGGTVAYRVRVVGRARASGRRN